MILQILRALVSEREPPKTVKSLAKRKTVPAVHPAEARHDAVARDLLVAHAEVVAGVLHQGVRLFEGTGVEEDVDALAGRQLPRFVLGVEALLAPAHATRLEELLEALHTAAHGDSGRGR